MNRLSRCAALLAAGMAAAKKTARKKPRRSRRAFVPTPDRAATLHATISVEPDQSLRPGELEPLLEVLRQRVQVALQFAVERIPATVHVREISIDGSEDTPVFPVALSARTFGEAIEIEEAIGALRTGTSLDGILHDSSGRAFRSVVWANFTRTPEADLPVGQVFTLEES